MKHSNYKISNPIIIIYHNPIIIIRNSAWFYQNLLSSTIDMFCWYNQIIFLNKIFNTIKTFAIKN